MSGQPLSIEDLADMVNEAAIVNTVGGELAVRLVGCARCGAEQGEVCRSNDKPSSNIHAQRRDAAFWRLSRPLERARRKAGAA